MLAVVILSSLLYVTSHSLDQLSSQIDLNEEIQVNYPGIPPMILNLKSVDYKMNESDLLNHELVVTNTSDYSVRHI